MYINGDGNWEELDETIDEHDTDMLLTLRAGLDNLVLVASLFSIVNTLFLCLTVPTLTIDTSVETNRLLLLLIQKVDGTAWAQDLPAAYSKQAAPSGDSVLINQLLSVSLTFSLLAAFGALLGQQWLLSYKNRPWVNLQSERSWERQRCSWGAHRWRLELALGVILPTVLHVAFLAFFLGMISYLRSISTSVAIPIITVIAFSFFIIIFTIVASILDPHCPFKIPAIGRLVSVTGRILHSLSPIWRRQAIRLWQSPSLSGLRASTDKWLVRSTSTEILQAHAIRHTLENMAHTQALPGIVYNILSMTNPRTLSSIYTSPLAMQRLGQLYEGYDPYYSHYAETISHLAIVARDVEGVSMEKELGLPVARLIHHATREYKNSDAGSTLPETGLPAVALAYVVDEIEPLQPSNRKAYCDFLIRSTSSEYRYRSRFTLGWIAWILLSCPDIREGLQQQLFEELGFGEPFPRKASRYTDPYKHAAAAYKCLSNPKGDGDHKLKPNTLLAICRAVEHCDPSDPLSQKLLLGLIEGLETILLKEMKIGFSSLLIQALGARLPDERCSVGGGQHRFRDRAFESMTAMLTQWAGEVAAWETDESTVKALATYVQTGTKPNANGPRHYDKPRIFHILSEYRNSAATGIAASLSDFDTALLELKRVVDDPRARW